MKKTYLLAIVMLFFSMQSFSQDDDLLNMLDEEVGEQTEFISATFKSTRIINGHSIERMPTKQLDLRINHRFGQLNSGAYELWGMDNALINISFEYGINDWFQVGIRRGTNKKTYDGSLKFSALRQSKGAKVMPVSVSYYVDASLKTLKGLPSIPDMNGFDSIAPRMAYTHQVLIGRKFNEQLSLQLSPSYVHRNLAASDEENDIIALGFGGRYKFSRRITFNFEYFYTTNVTKDNIYQYPLALGFDVETGGHVFQLFVTNSKPMVEDGFIGETTGDWLDGGLYFGFNISRVFAIGGNAH